GVVLCSGVVLGAALSAADACAAVVWGGVLLAALSGGLGAAHAVLLPTTARIESVSIALVASLTCAAELALAFTDSAAGERLMIAAAVLELVLVCVGIMLDVLPRNYFLISAATKVFKPQQIKPETRKSRRRRHDMSPGRPCLREQQNQLPLAGGRLARHQCEILKILIMAASASARLPPRATPLENEGTVQKDQQGHATATAAAAAVNALLRYSQRQKRHQSA
ncbi:membrane-associated protein, putative, partial [Bodo saltans]